MKPIPMLNQGKRNRWRRPLVLVIGVLASVGLLQWRLAAIYTRPKTVTPIDAAPAESTFRREDAQLFTRALAAGLLRLETDGRIAVAPADLPLRQVYAHTHPELLVPGPRESNWLAGVWDDDIRKLHQALHFSAAGRYVRQQVETFNARQLLAAIRWWSGADLADEWRVEWAGTPLTLAAMPPSIQRLLRKPPGDWRPWQWVARWPMGGTSQPVQFHWTPKQPLRTGHSFELLVVGGPPVVEGATVLASVSHCLKSRSCKKSTAVMHHLKLEWRQGASEVVVSTSPLLTSTYPDLFQQYGLTQIRREGERLWWRESTAAKTRVLRVLDTQTTPCRSSECAAQQRQPFGAHFWLSIRTVFTSKIHWRGWRLHPGDSAPVSEKPL